jgi:putative ABC transport system ATP-binding protein
MAAPMIELSGLRFRYSDGEFELHVPRLRVGRSETVAVIGPSGSGKSTLLHLIAGIEAPLSGRVIIDGEEISGLDDASRRAFRIRRLGLVFEGFELLEYLSVLDNILLPYRINRALRLDREVCPRAADLAGRVGIGDKLNRPATRLSHGEMQRVAICRALITDPPLLLADEPTGNLDPVNTTRVLEILFDAAAARGATLVTVTHEFELLERFGRVIDFKQFQAGASSAGEEPKP